MKEEELIQLIDNNRGDTVNLNDVKNIKILLKNISDDNKTRSKRIISLLEKSPFIAPQTVLDAYYEQPSILLGNYIKNNLGLVIPYLYEPLIDKNYFSIFSKLLRSLKAITIHDKITESAQQAPLLSALAELAIRTFHESYKEISHSTLSFNLITRKEHEFRKLLKFRFNQNDQHTTSLTLQAISKNPELTKLVITQVKDIIKTSNNSENVSDATLALMNVQDPQHSDVLIDRLEKETDPINVQLTIIEALGNLGSKKACNVLIKQFEREKDIAYNTTKALSMMGETALPDLIEALKNDQYVPYIVETMKRIGDVSVDYLIEALEEDKKSIRKNAAQCLTLVMSQKYGYEGSITHLVNQLEGKNKTIIESVTNALLVLGTPSIEVLIKYLNDEDRQLRNNSLNVLNAFGIENVEIALDGLLEINPYQAVKLGSLLYIYHPIEEYQQLGLDFAIKDDKFRVKPEDELFELIRRGLKEPEPIIRERTCEILYYFKSKAVPLLTNCLNDHNISVKRKAVEILRKIKSKRALVSLIEASSDNDIIVAELATRALGELKDPGALVNIIENMKHSSKKIRDSAVYAATQIGTTAVKKLSEELDSKNQYVVKSVSEAMEKIGNGVLRILLPKIARFNDYWFTNFEKVVSKIGESSISILQEEYKKAEGVKKDRIGILLATVHYKEIIHDAYNLVCKGKDAGIHMINHLCKREPSLLLKVIKESSKKQLLQFSKNSEGVIPQALYPTIKYLIESGYGKEIIDNLRKNNRGALKNYCKENNLEYDDLKTDDSGFLQSIFG